MVVHKFLKKRFCRLFYSLNINACHCLSALGGAVRAHTHIVCYTLYHRTKQWRSTLSNSTTPALWMKNAQYTAHSALRHRPKAQICRNYPRGPTPQKLPPENRWQKKGIEGALIWRFETDISAKIWQMRPLWNMRSASQSAGANVTNG